MKYAALLVLVLLAGCLTLPASDPLPDDAFAKISLQFET